MKTVTFTTGRISVVCPETAIRAIVVKPAGSSVIIYIGEAAFTAAIDEANLFEQPPAAMSIMDRQNQLAETIYNARATYAIPVLNFKSGGDGGSTGGATPGNTPTPPTPTPEAPGIS